MSFWSHIENFFKNIGQATTWAHTASVALSLVGPPAILIVRESLGDADATQATSVITQVQADLATVSQLLSNAQTGDPSVNGKVRALLTSIQANLATILADSHVKNSAKAAKITELVNAFSAEITVVLGMIPA
jgi:hypothetical protein